MKVKYVGFGGYMEVPCYEDENGKLYFDENDGRNGLNLYTGAYRTEWDEICGEPCNRVTEPIECDDPFVRHPRERDYMLLDRMRSDCNYFLGNGNGYEGHLWGGSVEVICDEMERIWNSLEEKPEWLSLEQIEDYRREMMKMKVRR
nr:MAG TPA: Large polyvalent protein-associated domain 11 [Caudoviricetes sp.]